MKFAIKYRNMNFKYESEGKNVKFKELDGLELKFKNYTLTLKVENEVRCIAFDGKNTVTGYIAPLNIEARFSGDYVIESGSFYRFLKDKNTN